MVMAVGGTSNQGRGCLLANVKEGRPEARACLGPAPGGRYSEQSPAWPCHPFTNKHSQGNLGGERKAGGHSAARVSPSLTSTCRKAA